LEIKPVELIGERAKIIPLEAIHTKDLFEAGRSAEIWTYMPRKVEKFEDMVLLVDEALTAKEKGLNFPFIIIDQETDRIVGSTRFSDISIPNRNLEIGWTWLSPETWRTRINTECKYLLLRHCFETLSTIRVQLKADARNVRSLRAMERMGAVKEGVLRKNRIMYDGYVRDSVYYSILVEEWAAIKARLEMFLGGHPTA
jgi:RimJ/RimL family protein N-acetyltransferase